MTDQPLRSRENQGAAADSGAGAAPAPEDRNEPSGADVHDARIGAILRAWRGTRGLSLRQAAARAGVAIGTVSQIERGLTSPSLRVLRELCAAIDLPMERLFERPGATPDEIVVRRSERRVLVLGEKRMRKELLTQKAGSGLQGMIVVIEPGGGSGDDPYTHDGEEIGHVLKGTLEITIGTTTYRLSPGDTFCFESPRPHKFRNAGQDEAEILWVVSQPFY
ncbi:cupin domain-containing protein [Algihabitans albus]|uniref:cupin domain-containing protein n=1 Tax=Algihabitans albus TaxID=2164067 RepID=UPI000E5D4170|nr:cupin domain-containing protein [Algihabitans albus]